MAKKSGKSAGASRAAKMKTAKSAKPAKSASAKSAAEPRRIKLGDYKTLRLQRRIRHPIKLPNVWQITRASARLLWEHRNLFIGITLIYGAVNVILAQGFSGGTDVSSLKNAFNQAFTGHLGFVPTGLSIFVLMVGSAGNTSSQTAGAYQIFLAVISSLAVIWSLRQVVSGRKPLVRDAFYRGMTPLIPFLIVLMVVGLELLPLITGSALYSLVINNGIAVYAVEKLLWALLFGAMGLLTFYLISSSVFALYIVTLPDMTPLKALRSARGLVRYRRWTVMRKLLCLPVILLIAAAVIMVPIIILLTPLARWVFFLLTMFSLTAIHTYIYTLYRELLNE
jgi:hypothetical protein